MDAFMQDHLQKWVEANLRDEFREPFKAYVTDQYNSDRERVENIGWSRLWEEFPIPAQGE